VGTHSPRRPHYITARSSGGGSFTGSTCASPHFGAREVRVLDYDVGEMILVVDDDQSIRVGLSTLLREEGYEVECSANGREALDLIRSGTRPCMILLDLGMPIMDGFGFLDAQDADPQLGPIPVVVITAGGLTGKIRGRPVLPKPLRVERLLQVVERFC
jgi:CheY-like chemotaxis protein